MPRFSKEAIAKKRVASALIRARGGRAIQRRTDQRCAIRCVAERAVGPLTAREVLDAAQHEVPGLGIATVYRNLKAFVDEGLLRQIDFPGESSRYELEAKGHHHHFLCDNCGRVFDIEGCSRAIEASLPRGFRVRRHEVLLYGLCPSCG